MKCKLCTSTKEKIPLYAGLVRCSECELIFYPHHANAAEIYNGNYFSGDEYRDYVADKDILQRNFRFRVQYLSTLKSSGRLLEVGCAYGFFLEEAQKRYEVEGIDVSKAAIDFAKNNGMPNLQCGDFLSITTLSQEFDLICLWDTIEHLEEPFLYLKKISDQLADGGVVVLTTGDIASFLATLRGEKWRQIHPPSHLFYFSEKTIRRALEQHGLEVLNIKNIGQYRSYRSMLFEIFNLRMPRLSWVYRVLTLNGRLDFPIYLNTFDIMQVSAIKPKR